MAKIIFLQQLAEEWLGVMYLSSMLKSHGHPCDVYVESLERDDIVKKVFSDSCDIIAFSCLTSDYHWALEKAKSIKKKSKTLIIMGGTHVTLNPDEAISNPNIDIICQGEGEYPITELADAFDGNGDYSRIKNLWFKKNGIVVRNEVRNLIEDLDSLPFPDRELYSKYAFFKKRGKRPLHLSRGCPYECAHCHNSSQKALFKDKGKYVRWRNVEGIVAEVKEIKKRSFIRVLHFIDDGFGINRDWLGGLLKRLSEMEGVRPAIQASMRADMVTEDLCDAFKDYGVDLLRIRFAVECGDERYRRTILKKEMTNRSLIQAANTFHKFKIDFTTYNMIGLPGETLDQAIETLRLNLRLRPRLAICFIYQPYPGTALCHYALENRFLDDQRLKKLGTAQYQGLFHSKSILRQEDIEKIVNLHKIFSTVAKLRFLFPFARILVRYRILTPLLVVIYKAFLFGTLLQRRRRDKY